MHREWKKGQINWEECKDAARLCRDEVRKSNAHMELNLARSKEEQSLLQVHQQENESPREHIPPSEQNRQANSSAQEEG